MKAWINPLELDGILAVDKPRGVASHDVVSRVRRLFRIDKAGHGGTLDTNATGLLLILLGKATKFFDTLLAKDKAYTCTMRLGCETNTQDDEGEVVAEKPFDYVTRGDLERVLSEFRGDIFQTPPPVNAVTLDGVTRFIRQEGERKQRFVHVFRLLVTGWEPPQATFDILCTKGAYLRTIAHDAGQMLGCGACLTGLRRTASGRFRVEDALPYADLDTLTPAQLVERTIPMPTAAALLKETF
ncbi:MAG: tRNA pseudouridine(55) synthase TruB [Kiritimatiellae bacterium]|nr:tRNA pseudouridine(55) synthase TruB [Kiritimatiellia bacterium]